MNKRITSWGWIWLDQTGKQVAAQVGHEWNGEVLTASDKRVLRRMARK